jgi:basic amino acid/polyamine antiporter, APA family
MTRGKLGLAAATAIVIANMIGVGVFTSTGYQAASLHDPGTILVAWVVGGVLALCGAAAYAELGAMMPRVGGEYVYLSEAYHPVVGTMSGWASLVAGFSAPIAAAAIAFAAYVGAVAPGLDAGAQKLVAIGLIVAMTALHAVDTVVGGRVQTVFTAAKALLIVVFVGAGLLLGSGDTAHFASASGGLSNIWTNQFAVSLMYVSFAYSGWNAAAYIAGELDRPERTVPRSLLVGTGVVMVLYVLLNVVFLYAVPSGVLATGSGGGPIKEVGDAAARALFGAGAGRVFSISISLALVSTVSAMVMAGPRVYTAMAEDGVLPRALARRTSGGAPFLSVALQGVIACAIVVWGTFDEIVRYVGFTLVIFAAMTVVAVFVLRIRRPGADRPYRTWGYPVTPVLFVAMSAWVAYSEIDQHPHESVYGLATVAVGAVAYAIARLRPAAGAAD